MRPTQPPVGAQGVVYNDWKRGLFDCCNDCGGCCLAGYCPCITLGRATHRVGLGDYSTVAWRMGILYVLACVPLAFPTSDPRWRIVDDLRRQFFRVILVYFVYRERVAMRTLLRIPGSKCNDAVASCFCPCCVIAQMASQVGLFGCECGAPDALDMDAAEMELMESGGGGAGGRGAGAAIMMTPIQRPVMGQTQPGMGSAYAPLAAHPEPPTAVASLLAPVALMVDAPTKEQMASEDTKPLL